MSNQILDRFLARNNLILLLFFFSLHDTVYAHTWDVNIQLQVPGYGAVPIQESVVIPDSGGTRSGASTPGFSLTHNTSSNIFSWGINLSTPIDVPGVGGCTAAVTLSGSGPVSSSFQGLSATGSVQNGNSTIVCTISGEAFSQSLPITGSFTAATGTAAGSGSGSGTVSPPPAGTAAVQGTASIRTALQFHTSASTFAFTNGTEILTGDTDTVIASTKFGSTITMDPASSLLLEYDSSSGFSALLLKGKVLWKVLNAAANTTFKVRTPLAVVAVRGTEFSTQYSEANGIGTTVVNVTEGQVEITRRDNSTVLLNPGQQMSFSGPVNRVNLLHPAHGNGIPQNATINFTWTAYPGASKYLFEATLYPTVLYPYNTTTIQNGSITMAVEPGQFSVQEGHVVWPLFIPANTLPLGQSLTWRIFPLNANGQLLSGATSSDTHLFGVSSTGSSATPSPSPTPTPSPGTGGKRTFKSVWVNATWSGGRTGTPLSSTGVDPVPSTVFGNLCLANQLKLENHATDTGSFLDDQFVVSNNCGRLMHVAVCRTAGTGGGTSAIPVCAVDPRETSASNITVSAISSSGNRNAIGKTPINFDVNVFWCSDESHFNISTGTKEVSSAAALDCVENQ